MIITGTTDTKIYGYSPPLSWSTL